MSPAAKSLPPTEYQVKAAFVFNFIRFIEFGEGKIINNEILLCTYKSNPLNQGLNHLNGKSIGNNKIIYKEIDKNSSIDQCSILIIDKKDEEELNNILKISEQNGILTISDIERYGEMGVIINMFLDDDKIKFEINISSAKASGLKISSRLLSLAKKIIDKKK